MQRALCTRLVFLLAISLSALPALVALSPPASGGLAAPAGAYGVPGGTASRPLADDLRGPAEVSGTDGEGLRVRRAPDLQSETRTILPEGTRVEVLEGPVHAAGNAWYRVRYGVEGDTGWTAAQYLLPSRTATAGQAGPTAPMAPIEPPSAAPPGVASTAPGGTAGATAASASDWRGYLVAPGPTVYEPVRPLPAVEANDPRFGLVEAFRLSDRGLSRVLGARHERLAFWWRGLQARPGGELNPFYLPTELLDREIRQGFQLLGLLMSTPDWAAASPADGPRSVPRNLHLPWDHRENYWGRFVEQIVREYRGRIDHWIIWNEPDIRPGDPNAAYYAWAGSIEDYYQLLRVAYRAAKAGNAAARVHLAGLTYWVDREERRPQYFERLLEVIAADPSAPANNHYFDVATLHLYTDPRGLYYVPERYRELMRARGMDKPIWVNETNVIPWDEPTQRGTGYDRPSGKRCTLADQASYLHQAFSLGLAAGVERIAVYKAEDGHGAAFNGDVDAVERAALVRGDGTLRPAFVAYQAAVHYLKEARGARYFPGATVEAVVVDRPAGGRTTVLWNGAPSRAVARLAAAGTRAELVDAVGQARPLEASPDGEYAIALSPATCNTDPGDPARYLMGGETYLVVEHEVPPDRAPRAPRAERLP